MVTAGHAEHSIFNRQKIFGNSMLIIWSLLQTISANAQVSAERVEGLRDNTPRWHAITGARLVLAPGKVIEKGTLVMRDGVIVAVGADVAIPAGARIWKRDGHTVYAGFVDLSSNVGLPAALRARTPALMPWAPGAMPGANMQTESKILAARSLAARNRFIRAEIDVAQQLELKPDDIKAARELGFTSVLAAPATGIFRGQSTLLNLSDGQDAKSQVLIPRAAQHLAMEYERSPDSVYPSSLMGAIALIRQTFYDARWYHGAHEYAQTHPAAERPQPNASLEALFATLAASTAGRQAIIFQSNSEQDYLRTAKIRDEFSLRVIGLGNGFEYRRAAQIKSLTMPMIVPINFPAPPEIENPDSAIDVPLETLQHWEQAPSNLGYLHQAGVEFAITAQGLRDPGKEFWSNLRLAVRRGLPADQALAGLTTTPAKLIGASRQLGSLEVGKLANLIIANGDLFANDQAEIETTFVEGRPYYTAVYDRIDVRGRWNIVSSNPPVQWEIGGTQSKPQLKLDGGVCDLNVRARQVVMMLPCTKPDKKADAGEGVAAASTATATATATATSAPLSPAQTIVADFNNDALRGSIQIASGASSVWSAQRVAAFIEPASVPKAALKKETMPPTPALPSSYPAGTYSVDLPTRPAQLLIRNATIWTSAAAGQLFQTDMLVRDGRIAAIGPSLVAPANTEVIEAAGKHVTPGIIDAHSHTAISGGVNESASSITAEVRIGDVLDATDINIYRELAGGVTAANVLHGSANSIGGQNQVIKMRWGSDAEGLKFIGAMPGIKFALGENVKQSNWGITDRANARYPQTRMGVEQIMRDGFQAARLYQQRWNTWRAAAKNEAKTAEPRRDLQLDTLVEILDKKRVIHIHSYRADEILMFVKLAKEFGFNVATFQHVLEGYKVADAIASIGAGGSTFSDWWGYKMEALDAIPTNGAIMHKAGVLMTFNSDSDELARRLNTEAAKAVKYGGMAEADAFKFVTINAARQLRIDQRTGSLEVGKDADFVIWSDNPLSTQARAEETWIEGQRYFDLRTDASLRESAKRERERLIAKALPMRIAGMNMARMNMARPNSAEAAGASANPASAPPASLTSVSGLMEYVAFQNWLHQSSHYRDGYWSGGQWHECTEDGR